mmetsp:Transcript_26832/g.88051  ORF Transcript_26832/g.88051 Transcript_26832/m.88051 type:complete len:608 (+) Transcript_26832:366-2189(+)
MAFFTVVFSFCISLFLFFSLMDPFLALNDFKLVRLRVGSSVLSVRVGVLCCCIASGVWRVVFSILARVRACGERRRRVRRLRARGSGWLLACFWFFAAFVRVARRCGGRAVGVPCAVSSIFSTPQVFQVHFLLVFVAVFYLFITLWLPFGLALFFCIVFLRQRARAGVLWGNFASLPLPLRLRVRGPCVSFGLGSTSSFPQRGASCSWPFCARAEFRFVSRVRGLRTRVGFRVGVGAASRRFVFVASLRSGFSLHLRLRGLRSRVGFRVAPAPCYWLLCSGLGFVSAPHRFASLPLRFVLAASRLVHVSAPHRVASCSWLLFVFGFGIRVRFVLLASSRCIRARGPCSGDGVSCVSLLVSLSGGFRLPSDFFLAFLCCIWLRLVCLPCCSAAFVSCSLAFFAASLPSCLVFLCSCGRGVVCVFSLSCSQVVLCCSCWSSFLVKLVCYVSSHALFWPHPLLFSTSSLVIPSFLSSTSSPRHPLLSSSHRIISPSLRLVSHATSSSFFVSHATISSASSLMQPFCSSSSVSMQPSCTFLSSTAPSLLCMCSIASFLIANLDTLFRIFHCACGVIRVASLRMCVRASFFVRVCVFFDRERAPSSQLTLAL